MAAIALSMGLHFVILYVDILATIFQVQLFRSSLAPYSFVSFVADYSVVCCRMDDGVEDLSAGVTARRSTQVRCAQMGRRYVVGESKRRSPAYFSRGVPPLTNWGDVLVLAGLSLLTR